MKYLLSIGVILAVSGGLMILFAKQLGAFYEGQPATMSDLGFIASGMMLAGAGVILVIITLALCLWRKSR